MDQFGNELRAARSLRVTDSAIYVQHGGAVRIRVTHAEHDASRRVGTGKTLPVGYVIGTRPRLARVLQPVAQVLAALPATALFPVILLVLIRLPGGLNIAAILLMLMGTQWYLLFNVIAGASAIPRDLRDTTDLLRLSRASRWRTLILPALFPFIITGAITATGGAWNASIVAEFVEFGGQTHATFGIGSAIAATRVVANTTTSAVRSANHPSRSEVSAMSTPEARRTSRSSSGVGSNVIATTRLWPYGYMPVKECGLLISPGQADSAAWLR